MRKCSGRVQVNSPIFPNSANLVWSFFHLMLEKEPRKRLDKMFWFAARRNAIWKSLKITTIFDNTETKIIDTLKLRGMKVRKKNELFLLCFPFYGSTWIDIWQLLWSCSYRSMCHFVLNLPSLFFFLLLPFKSLCDVKRKGSKSRFGSL